MSEEELASAIADCIQSMHGVYVVCRDYRQNTIEVDGEVDCIELARKIADWVTVNANG